MDHIKNVASHFEQSDFQGMENISLVCRLWTKIIFHRWLSIQEHVACILRKGYFLFLKYLPYLAMLPFEPSKIIMRSVQAKQKL